MNCILPPKECESCAPHVPPAAADYNYSFWVSTRYAHVCTGTTGGGVEPAALQPISYTVRACLIGGLKVVLRLHVALLFFGAHGDADFANPHLFLCLKSVRVLLHQHHQQYLCLAGRFVFCRTDGVAVT